MKTLLSVLLVVLPWPARRLVLIWAFGYRIHPTARIGFSIITPDRLEMAPNSRIGSLTVCKGAALLRLGERASIGNLNWITGFPAKLTTSFTADIGRRPQLILGAHAAITNRHMIDCTNSVEIGKFTTVAGFRSQILTHSIDLYACRQSSNPITIGEYCFVGTASVLLGGSTLPDYSVLGAGSVLNKVYTQDHCIYAGIPARPVKELPHDLAYFQRKVGFVH